MFLEVIAKDINDIEQINNSDADRIELCGAMKEDGLTPDMGLIKADAKISKKPIRVMIINHNNGFYYTEQEITTMITQIKQINNIANIEGYVIGCLNKTGDAIDIVTMQRLIKAANKRKITCHKACESVINNFETIDTLAKLNVNAILTQGETQPIYKTIIN